MTRKLNGENGKWHILYTYVRLFNLAFKVPCSHSPVHPSHTYIHTPMAAPLMNTDRCQPMTVGTNVGFSVLPLRYSDQSSTSAPQKSRISQKRLKYITWGSSPTKPEASVFGWVCFPSSAGHQRDIPPGDLNKHQHVLLPPYPWHDWWVWLQHEAWEIPALSVQPLPLHPPTPNDQQKPHETGEGNIVFFWCISAIFLRVSFYLFFCEPRFKRIVLV